jgi:predicted RND superfamily exporter protein
LLPNIKACLRQIHSEESQERVVIKDSDEYDSYAELAKHTETSSATVASEGYYVFESSQTIKEFDLKNLKKSQYDVIRNFVKLRLLSKLDMEIKTCQLSSPSSPRDRSKKLNSLSNKISSYDYRCEITCEIFKDYSIGVVVWNEMFSDRKTMNPVVLKNQTFIYQTTAGKWKYTSFK